MKKLSIKFTSGILILTIIFSFIQIFFIKSEVKAALSNSYTQYVKSGISSFPESYQKKLAYLKYIHPNWEFKAYYTGIDWNELTSSAAENKCLKNTIHKGGLLDPTVLCICGKGGDVGYYCASAKTVNYYLDPRNFMGEAMVFQFLDLSNGTGITRDVVQNAVKGTYLVPYVDDIMAAASESKISPMHIVATIFQELGKTGTPKAISGTVPGYEGVYNFYNYGATDGAGAVERGLAKAKELGWTTPRIALTDGAKKVLADGYISAGQTTKYFYKFDVVGNEILTEAQGQKTYPTNNFYWHQYMTNLRDPSSQAGSLYDIYLENNILNEKLTFTIPVYNNMPATVATPTSLTANDGELCYINSMKKWGVTMRAGASTSSTSLGNLYKDTVVALLGTEGAFSKIKINKVTGYDANTKTWTSTPQIGYVASEYIAKLGTDVPDYRDKVNMGADTGTNVVNPDGNFGKADIKIEKTSAIITPATTVKEMKTKYPNCVIKMANGTVITDEKVGIPTGAIITVDGASYTAVKYADTNGDGTINSGDLLKIQKHLLNVSKITDANVITAADVTKDGILNSGDLLKIQKYLLKVSDIEL